MTRRKKYQDVIKIAKSIGETGKTVARMKTYFILCLVLIAVIVVGVLVIQIIPQALVPVDGDDGGVPPETITLQAPVLNPIIPNPDLDGHIQLSWNQIDIPNYDINPKYAVERSKDGDSWIHIFFTNTGQISCSDPYSAIGVALESGEYKYRVYALQTTAYFRASSDYSNIQTVIIETPIPKDLPSNPSIIINGGAVNTSSLTVTLTLYCDNADKMRFQISVGYWTNWTSYKTTYDISLFINDPDYPDYRIGVEFRNQYGSCPDEPYDDITYMPSNKNGGGDGNGDEYDYTTVYILIAVLIGIIGAGIFLRYKKRREK